MFENGAVPTLNIFSLQVCPALHVIMCLVEINDKDSVFTVNQNVSGMQVGMIDVVVEEEIHLLQQFFLRSRCPFCIQHAEPGK